MGEIKLRKWCIFSAMLTTIAMIFTDATVLPVALPSIQRELGLSDLTLQWLVNAYLLSLSTLLIVGGRLSDMFGRRRVYAFGVALFALSSALCGISDSAGWFVAARALQGAGGALLLPSSNSILVAAFGPHERGRAMGLYLSTGSIFLVLGPLVGGMITQYLEWNYVFWINLPISAVGLTLLFLFVPPFEGIKQKIDWVGCALLLSGSSTLIIGLMQTPSWGWSSWATWTLVLSGAALLTALIAIKREVEHPFIEVSFFYRSQYTAAVICIFLVQFLMMINVFWALYFQQFLGFSPSLAGIMIVGASCPTIFIAPLAGHLTDRRGPRLPASIGFLLTVTGLLLFIHSLNQPESWRLFPGLLLYGCGIPMVLNPCFVSAMNEISQRKWGVAIAVRQTVRQFGGTLGVATIGGLFLHIQVTQLAERFKHHPATENLDTTPFEGILSSSPGSLKALEGLPDVTAEAIRTIYQNSYITAFKAINLISAGIALLGFLIAFFFLSPRKSTQVEH